MFVQILPLSHRIKKGSQFIVEIHSNCFTKSFEQKKGYNLCIFQAFPLRGTVGEIRPSFYTDIHMST